MTIDGSTEPTMAGEDIGSTEKPPERVLVGYFSADTDVDMIVDAILAMVPPDQRPKEDRPERVVKHP